MMRKYSLRVGRLKRVSYGPYSLDELVPNPNDLQEVSMTAEIKRLMYDYYKGRAVEAKQTLAETKQEAEIKKQKQLGKLASSARGDK